MGGQSWRGQWGSSGGNTAPAVRLKNSAFLGEEEKSNDIRHFSILSNPIQHLSPASDSPTVVVQTSPLQCRPVPLKSSEVTPLYQTQRSGRQPRRVLAWSDVVDDDIQCPTTGVAMAVGCLSLVCIEVFERNKSFMPCCRGKYPGSLEGLELPLGQHSWRRGSTAANSPLNVARFCRYSGGCPWDDQAMVGWSSRLSST